MKQQLIALTLITSSGLIAGEATGHQSESSYCGTCCCTPCCCKPCCVPKPKPCIDCECYTPAFYDLQCDWGFSFDVAFLYWYAGETNLSYALTVNTQAFGSGTREILTPVRYKYLDAEWDPGVRIGLGWNSDCDGWDANLNWTWFKNCSSASTSVPEFSGFPTETTFGIINPWLNQGLHGNDIAIPDSVSAKWRVRFNQIDLEIGRKYWNSRCFALRPYAALRGAWWRTRFKTTTTRTEPTTGTGPDESGSFNLLKDNFKNKVWGVGFVGGLQPTWYFCSNFALYANFDVALIWGEFEASKKESLFSQNLVTEETDGYSNRSRGEFYQMSPMLDTAIGLRWEETWCCDRYRTALDFGWEHHTLFDQNHRMKTIDSVGIDTNDDGDANFQAFKTYSETTGNLSMGGFVLRARFDF